MDAKLIPGGIYSVTKGYTGDVSKDLLIFISNYYQYSIFIEVDDLFDIQQIHSNQEFIENLNQYFNNVSRNNVNIHFRPKKEHITGYLGQIPEEILKEFRGLAGSVYDISHYSYWYQKNYN